MTTASACCNGCSPGNGIELAMACTLGAVAGIRDLAGRSLRS